MHRCSTSLGCTRAIRIALLIAIWVALGVWFAAPAQAVPSFARKYRTTCQTCHTQYPRLNPFGEAFRVSGYQYPEGDVDVQKGEPLQLGAEKYKELFPDAIWPATILDSVPLSVRGQWAVLVNLQEDADTELDFQFPTNLAVNLAGTLSEDIGLWIGFHLDASGTIAAGQVAVSFSNLFDTLGVPRHLLNVKAGQFESESQPYSGHRLTTVTPSRLGGFNLVRWADAAARGQPVETSTGHAHLEARKGDASHDAADAEVPVATGEAGPIRGGSSLYGLDRGIEIYGVIASRLLYAVGVWSGNGAGAPVKDTFDTDSGKDVAARLQYKLGGMALDGSGDVDPKNWRELSAALGVSFRYGSPRLLQTRADGGEYFWHSASVRVGADLDIRLQDVQLTLAAAWQRHADPAGNGDDAVAIGWSAEVHVVWLAWLQSTLRYEGVVAGQDYGWAEQDVVANLTFLIRPNVKALAEVVLDLKDPDQFSKGAHALLFGLDAAF